MPLIQNVALAQLIAYICLTITSVIVATVSLRFSYRQNFGWAPLMIVSTHGHESEFGPGKDESIIRATVEFEVWNRRTYPIILEGAEIRFRQDILEPSVPSLDNESAWWVEAPSVCAYLERLAVKNGEHHAYKLSVPMKPGLDFKDIDGMIDIEVTCFDPRREREYKLKQSYRYHFKSAAELGKT